MLNMEAFFAPPLVLTQVEQTEQKLIAHCDLKGKRVTWLCSFYWSGRRQEQEGNT